MLCHSNNAEYVMQHANTLTRSTIVIFIIYTMTNIYYFPTENEGRQTGK